MSAAGRRRRTGFSAGEAAIPQHVPGMRRRASGWFRRGQPQGRQRCHCIGCADKEPRSSDRPRRVASQPAGLHKNNDTTTTVAHAAEMIRELAGWLPDRKLHLCADGAYASLAGADLPRTQVTSRMRRDAALYEPAPTRTGRRGRPRTKGDRLPTPTGLATQASGRGWRKVTVDLRGRPVERLVHVRDVLWYAVNKTDLVRLVIAGDPAGVEPDDFFVTTDTSATGAQVASRYAGRWSIEVCFRDVKQHLGGQDPQSWKRQGPERAAALSLWLHALTWCWYLHTHPGGRTWIPRPWYQAKATPSFLDALAALRRTLWSQRITTMSGSARDNHQITEALLDTLAYAA